jgi:outer membrane murein-binding lipoprotein Lpp
MKSVKIFIEEKKMKKALSSGLILTMLALVITFLVSCSGISQEKYDKVNSDLTAAQAQIQKLQGDLTAKDTELKATSAKLAKAKNEIEVLNSIFIPALTGELNNKTQDEMTSVFLSWRDKVNTIGDATLSTKFQAIMDSGGGNEATMAFFRFLLEDIEKTVK